VTILHTFGKQCRDFPHIAGQNDMTVFFVSRHPGALNWMRRRGIVFDRLVPHLAMGDVREGYHSSGDHL
jgi:hypothetical protein